MAAVLAQPPLVDAIRARIAGRLDALAFASVFAPRDTFALDFTRASPLTDEGAAELAAVLAAGGQVTGLNLASASVLSNVGVAHIARLRSLRSLDLANSQHVTDGGARRLRQLTALTRLGLAGCTGISDAGVAYISDLTGLRSLDLAGCARVTAAGIACLSHLALLTSLRAPCDLAIPPYAHSRDIQQHWRDESLALAPVLGALTALERLTARWGAPAALVRLPRTGALRELRLACCDMEDLRYVAGALPGLTSLELCLHGYPRVTADDAAHLARGLPRLRRLALVNARFQGPTIAKLGALTGLEALRLRNSYGTAGDDATEERASDFLSRLRALTCLEIAGVSASEALADAHLAAIACHAPLRRLALSDSPHFTAAGVAALTRLTALTALELHGIWKEYDSDEEQENGAAAAMAGWPPCAGLAALVAALPLRELLLEAPYWADVSFLRQLTSVTKLELRGASASALAALPALSGSLASLALINTFLLDFALPAAVPLTSLTHLAFSQAGVAKGGVTDGQLAGLRGLPRLRVLSIALVTEHHGLTDAGVDHLLALPRLRRLSFQLDELGAVTAACVARVKAHPATLYCAHDGFGGVFQRIGGEPPLNPY